MTENQRPGVYSSYTVSSSYSVPRSLRTVAVVVKAASSLAGNLLSFSGYGEAASYLEGENENEKLLACVKILFQSGISRVFVSVVDTSAPEAYTDALSLIRDENGIGAVVCDAMSASDLATLKDSVMTGADNMRERVAFAGFDSPADALSAAEALNCERVVICCPAGVPVDVELGGAIFSAAAMAGAVVSQNDASYNWNGARLAALSSCAKLPEDEIQRLIASGITVLEELGEGVCCIRAVTTRTRTNSVKDLSLRPLNSVLIIDEVMRTVRDSLKVKLTGARLSMQSVASQVTVILSSCRDEGLIENFDSPVVRQDVADPSVCVVELGFKIAHVLSQIRIAAHIRI